MVLYDVWVLVIVIGVCCLIVLFGGFGLWLICLFVASDWCLEWLCCVVCYVWLFG